MKKARVGIICGGESVEHEVSLQSAKNICDVLDKNKYEYVLIGITKEGKWFFLKESELKKLYDAGSFFSLDDHGLCLEQPCLLDKLYSVIDVVFPVLHGNFGEDGAVQGLFKCLHIPCVGPGILDAAMGMDKEVLKRLVSFSGIKVADFIVFSDIKEVDFQKVVERIGLPVFIKPSNSGSSLGISKVKNHEEFEKAVKEAFKYDHKILVEQGIDCREIECSVLGNENPKVSLPGEVIPHHEFYSYEAKYLDENGASFGIPAKLSESQIDEVKQLALKIFKLACCSGMARVDFFLDKEGVFYFNEINSIPGFTRISLYPKLWEVSGLSQANLVDQLILLAFDKQQKNKNLADVLNLRTLGVN